jgi:hypothetical protein
LSVQASSNGGGLVVTCDGRGLEGRAGVGLLREAADRFGLTARLRSAVDRVRSFETHAPGAVVRDLAVMLADGGTSVSDIATLRRSHDALFATVASQPTAWRTIEALAADDLAVHRMFDAVAATRQRLWDLGAAPASWDDPTVPVYVDIDATLVTAHSEKDRAAGTYKGGFGFAPIVAFVDRDDGRGEPLGLLLRPGNAGANTIVDNADVLEQALAWLPETPNGKPVVARGDSAMATCGFVTYARQASVNVSVSLPIGDHPKIQTAIHALHTGDADDAVWTPATRPDGGIRDVAHVAELADVPLADHWPPGLRVIVRREPLHPGAQQTFADIDGHRFTAVLTDLPGDPVALEAGHRARARVENRIRDAKDTGLRNLPCGDFDRNHIWAVLVLIALTLVCWTQTLLLTGALALARPATLRYRIWHIAARVARHGRRTHIRLAADWPWATALRDAFTRLWALHDPAC